VREITVPGERLDAVPGGRVDFLNVDVEGSELMVFQGAAGVLRRDRPALEFESGPGGAELFGYGCTNLYNYLKEFGYYIYPIRVPYLRLNGRRAILKTSMLKPTLKPKISPINTPTI
jgi:hypothetical protein